MHVRNRFLKIAASAAVLFLAVPASASPDPKGVWIDHTGRGAVEITDCDGALCGRVVWLKDEANKQACGVQILGDVKPSGSGVWDRGWIYDPEEDAKFSVELKPIGAEKLRVLGYLGTKLFSETMVWERAPADLQRCGTQETTAALDPPPNPETSEPAASEKPKLANEPPAMSDSQPPAAPASPAEPTKSAEAATGAGQERPARNKARSKECKVETPWLSFSFPCPD